MSRILVIGVGVPSLVEAGRHGGPGLRSTHFASAIAAAGHEVLLVAVLAEHEPVPPHPVRVADGGLRMELVSERELSSPAVRTRLARFAPDAVVGATAYASALAARLRLDVPLWADVFGDLMAEAQAKAARTASDWSLVHFWTLMRTVLERGDRFSAVSVAQSHALVGQLGLAGRLSSRTSGEELVSVVPCAAEVPAERPDRRAARRALGFAEDDFVLLVSGGVNTWCDVETLGSALGLAMAEEPRLRLLVTGGAIPGHDETSHAELGGRLRALPASRVHDLGWVGSARLPEIYAAADLGLHVERALYERRLGAENRVIEWLAHGLACVTTAASESGAQLVRDGLALGTAAGDAHALAGAILAASREGPHEARLRGPAWVARERSFAAAAAPLLAWCAAPCFARDRDGARLLQIGLVSHPSTSAEMLEAYVAELPVGAILRRGMRWLFRRCMAALARLVRSRAAAPSQEQLPAPRRSRSALPSVLLLALLSSMSGVGCTRGSLPAGGAGAAGGARPNILLISIDTLRHDHLGAYGYAAAPSPSPWIDDLASRSMLVETALTSAPETAPALASLLTGVYQDRHGVFFNRGKLVEEARTLAERLKEQGYSTAAFVGNLLADPARGFAQGFDRYEIVPAGPTIDDRVVARTGDFLRTQTGSPWFVWVHMMDPHGPYNSAIRWWSKDFDYSKAPLAGDGEFPISESNFGLGVIPAYQKIEGAVRLSDYVRRYDGEVRFTDSQVGALAGMLAATGQAEDTIVVVTADHGESLTEHGELLQHGWFVYDPTVRIPLVVAWPRRMTAKSRVTQLVCAVDLVPTLLDLAAVEADGADFDGRSFAPEGAASGSVSAAGAEATALRDAGCFSIGPRPNHLIALRTAAHKLIVTPAGTPRDPRAEKDQVTDDPERVELYDVAHDPGETTDIAASDPERVESMKQSVTSLRSRFRAGGWRW